MKLRENCLYVQRVSGTKYNDEKNMVEYQLTNEFLCWDKGRAIYYHGFDSPYVLIGLLRVLFGEQARMELVATSSSLEQTFVLGNHGFVATWTGEWTPLEKLGFIAVIFTQGMLQVYINEIHENLKEHGGKLANRN